MRHAIWVSVCAAITVLVCANPANAQITGAVISTDHHSYVGPCPVTIAFDGSVIGKPGTVFSYNFNQFIDSVQHIAGGATMRVPAGRIVKVSDSISISKSTSGVTFDQIWVHNISGSQPDFYSNKANFSVVCGAPPKPRPIRAPTKLTNTV